MTIDPEWIPTNVTCNLPTEHYSSGRALLLKWDANRNKTLSHEETVAAIQALISCEMGIGCPIPISVDEAVFIQKCYEDYNGDINAMCPEPPTPTSFWIFLLVVAIIIMYMLGGKK